MSVIRLMTFEDGVCLRQDSKREYGGAFLGKEARTCEVSLLIAQLDAALGALHLPLSPLVVVLLGGIPLERVHPEPLQSLQRSARKHLVHPLRRPLPLEPFQSQDSQRYIRSAPLQHLAQVLVALQVLHDHALERGPARGEDGLDRQRRVQELVAVEVELERAQLRCDVLCDGIDQLGRELEDGVPGETQRGEAGCVVEEGAE